MKNKRNIFFLTVLALFLLAGVQDSLAAAKTILFKVPFISQAPTANWKDSRQQDGCEEASVLMAVAWARGKALSKGKAGEKSLLAISDWEQRNYKNYHDTSAKDTAARLLKGYYNFNAYQVKENSSVAEIKSQLSKGNIIIAPMNGQKLKNPNFTQPGPEHHMLVIIGYDAVTKKFITNDPGTRKGERYKYSEKIINEAWRDYPTGNHLPARTINKNMIVVRPDKK